MSDMQPIMKFELLPNEILIECFEYLNAIDIFYSFDFLNSRFCTLIRNIPLHLNIENVKKSTLVKFCTKMLLNSQIKEQIISLKLSNKNTFKTVQTLFLFVSLDELFQLRSLILIDLDVTTVRQISSMLPLLTNLRYFRMTGSSYGKDEILSSLPASTMQTLSIPRLNVDLALKNPFMSLVNLTVSRCSIKGLCYFFKYLPNLQYLSIERIFKYTQLIIDELDLIATHAINLKQLGIHSYEDAFEWLGILLDRTPNLTLLMISANDNLEILNAWRWQNLITTSLPVLDFFKFKFSLPLINDDSDIVDKFQQFQTDFWHQQHHWYIEWIFDKYRALIYTIPYISDEYRISPYTKRYYNESINNAKTFANVIDLTLCPEAITDSYQYYFSNVKSLQLEEGRADDNYVYPFFKTKRVQCLKTIVNLCNITHLDILSECRLKSSSVLLHLLQEIPYLSSLKIDKDTLFSLFNNRELCECFNKMIKKLDITDITDIDSYRFLDFTEIVKLCQIFTNMVDFSCNVCRVENLQMILNQLSALSHMKDFSYETPHRETCHYWLKDHASQLDLYSFTIECQTGRYYDDDYDNDPFLLDIYD